MSRDQEIILSSGNVFADLGLADADELMLKAELALAVTRRIEELGLTQTEAAKRLKTTQNKVSKIMNAHLDGFSVFRLGKYLTALGCRVHLTLDQQGAGMEVSLAA